MNQRLVLAVLLLPLMACASSGSSRENAASKPYNLQIAFYGLIAFAEDSGKVWAFLVNAEYKEGQHNEKSLPPGVYKEVQENPALLGDYPPHYAYIRFRNARIVEGNVPDPKIGLHIKNQDLRFTTSATKLKSAQLDELAGAKKIIITSPKLSNAQKKKIHELDKIDPLLTEQTLDPRLAARALIQTGKVRAQPNSACKNPARYLFKLSAAGDSCPGKVNSSRTLAEEVIVTQKVSGPTVIHLGDKKISVLPENPVDPVIVEVVNQTWKSINNPEKDLCKSEHQHLASFRWFYRLLTASKQEEGSSDHLFPCVKKGNFGDPKCPQKIFVLEN